MNHCQSPEGMRARRALVPAAVCALAFALIILSPPGQAQQQQQQKPQQSDGRPRRAAPVQQTPPARPAPTPKPTSIFDQAPPAMPTPTPSPEGEEIDPEDRITVDTGLVNLNVRVIDRNNRPISDVRREDFRVFEDGVPQEVVYFTREEVPISYGVAVDNSGSMRSQLDKVIEAGKTIVGSNKPGDETFVVRFIDSDHIETMQDFTANKTLLEDAIDNMYIEGGQTAVIDAVYLSAERIAQYKKGDDNDRRRRALIIVTDGEDRSSFYKQDQLFERLREEDVQIYVIGFVNELDKEGGLIKKSAREKAVKLLERLAKETGGRSFFPASISELPGIADEITRDLRTQYVVSYSPTNKARDGSYRAVRVSVADASGKDKRIALTRAGYTAQRGGGSPAAAPPKTPTTGTTRPTASGRTNP